MRVNHIMANKRNFRIGGSDGSDISVAKTIRKRVRNGAREQGDR